MLHVQFSQSVTCPFHWGDLHHATAVTRPSELVAAVSDVACGSSGCVTSVFQQSPGAALCSALWDNVRPIFQNKIPCSTASHMPGDSRMFTLAQSWNISKWAHPGCSQGTCWPYLGTRLALSSQGYPLKIY